jgi:ribonuclease P protein component
MLPKQNRISKDCFGEILSKGRIFYAAYFMMRSLPAKKTLFAVSVSKKVAKNAVDRNRIRRRVYSLLGEVSLKTELRSENVISAKIGANKISFELQKEDILKLLKKAGLI